MTPDLQRRADLPQFEAACNTVYAVQGHDEVAEAKRRLIDYSCAPGPPGTIRRNPAIVAAAIAIATVVLVRTPAARVAVRMAGFVVLRLVASNVIRSVTSRF